MAGPADRAYTSRHIAGVAYNGDEFHFYKKGLWEQLPSKSQDGAAAYARWVCREADEKRPEPPLPTRSAVQLQHLFPQPGNQLPSSRSLPTVDWPALYDFIAKECSASITLTTSVDSERWKSERVTEYEAARRHTSAPDRFFDPDDDFAAATFAVRYGFAGKLVDGVTRYSARDIQGLKRKLGFVGSPGRPSMRGRDMGLIYALAGLLPEVEARDFADVRLARDKALPLLEAFLVLKTKALDGDNESRKKLRAADDKLLALKGRVPSALVEQLKDELAREISQLRAKLSAEDQHVKDNPRHRALDDTLGHLFALRYPDKRRFQGVVYELYEFLAPKGEIDTKSGDRWKLWQPALALAFERLLRDDGWIEGYVSEVCWERGVDPEALPRQDFREKVDSERQLHPERLNAWLTYFTGKRDVSVDELRSEFRSISLF